MFNFFKKKKARAIIKELLESDCTHLASEVITLEKLEAEYPDVIKKVDEELAQIHRAFSK